MKSDHGPRLWSRKTNMVLMIEDRPGVYMLYRSAQEKNELPIGDARVHAGKNIIPAGARVFTVQDRRDGLQDIRRRVSVYPAACRVLSRVLHRIPAARSVMQDQDRDQLPGAVSVYPGLVPGYLLPIGACFNPGPLRRDYCSIPGPHAPRGCSSRRRDRVTAAGGPGGIIPGPENHAKRPSKTFVKTFLKNS